MELETGSRARRDNNITHKRLEYTLDKALQVVLEFDDENDYSHLSDWESVYSESSDCNQLQLVFVPDLLQQKQLDDT